MKKFLSVFLCLMFLFSLSISVFADDTIGPMQKSETVKQKVKEPNQTEKSFDKIVSDIMGVQPEDGKVNIYFFHGDGCPHCADERRFFQMLAPKYSGKINIIDFEVWKNPSNGEKLDEIMKIIDDKKMGIPYTIIGNERFVGFSDTTSAAIEKKIKSELELTTETENNIFKLPILGEINAKEISIPLTAIVLGFVDGFNPCAMWVLLFLINMLLTMQNKKRKWILGLTFLFVSGLVYFCSMVGINFVVSAITINSIKKLLAAFISFFGLFNIYKYIKTRKTETGCTVVKDTKRKKIIERIKEITKEESFIFAIIGVIFLAVSVNLVELACSLGFPIVFSEIMAINNIDQVTSIGYTLLYILFYMIDDIAVFAISMITLEATGITNKYNKLCTLISGLIMTIMGILLIVKPEWIMLNF